MGKTLNAMRRAINGLLVAILAIMFVVVFLQVFFRYVFDQPLRWSEELARILLIWTTFLGAAVAIERRTHFRVDAFVEALPRGIQAIVKILTNLLVVAYVVFIIAGTFYMLTSIRMGTTPALQIPIKYIYIALPIGGLLMILNLLDQVFALTQEARRGAR